jgi:hypothetical protein
MNFSTFRLVAALTFSSCVHGVARKYGDFVGPRDLNIIFLQIWLIPPTSAVHCAFDLLELDGRGLRREPIEKRKEYLRSYCATRT